MIQVKQISAEQTYEIRREILRKNISLTEKNDDDLLNTAYHFGGFVHEKLVGIATFIQNDSEFFEGYQYRLRGMATLEEYQGNGIGKIVLKESIKFLKEKDVQVLWCNARTNALNFYQKLGFNTIGAEFDIHLIGPHYVMYLNI
jgi:predicted GNAT family N-acyltransferase